MTIAADAQDVEAPAEGAPDCSMPAVPPPDSEGGWGLAWEQVEGVRVPSVAVYPYGAGTETELRVLVFRSGEPPVEWALGPYPAEADGHEVVDIDLSQVVGTTFAAVSVVASAFHASGQELGSHGVTGYAYVDGPGSIVIVTEAEALALVVPAAGPSDDGFVEVPNIVGQAVVR